MVVILTPIVLMVFGLLGNTLTIKNQPFNVGKYTIVPWSVLGYEWLGPNNYKI